MTAQDDLPEAAASAPPTLQYASGGPYIRPLPTVRYKVVGFLGILVAIGTAIVHLCSVHFVLEVTDIPERPTPTTRSSMTTHDGRTVSLADDPYRQKRPSDTVLSTWISLELLGFIASLSLLIASWKLAALRNGAIGWSIAFAELQIGLAVFGLAVGLATAQDLSRAMGAGPMSEQSSMTANLVTFGLAMIWPIVVVVTVRSRDAKQIFSGSAS